MKEKPIVEIKVINFFDFIPTKNGLQKENLNHMIVYRREGEETYKPVKVKELPFAEKYNSEFKLS